MQLILMRHGQTLGNQKGWFLGRTDEPLCPEGVAQAESLAPGPRGAGVSRVYVSPLERVRQTARICFPAAAQVPVDGFREMDFGAFEAKSHADLDGDPAYQAWLDSFCEDPCPGGEGKAGFMARNVQALEQVLDRAQEAGEQQVVVVAHGGTVMSCFHGLADNPRGYFDWHVGNCGGYAAEAVRQGETWVLRDCRVFDAVADVL